MQHLRQRHTQASCVSKDTFAQTNWKTLSRDLLSNTFCLCFVFVFFLQPLQINLNLSFQSAAPVWHVSELRIGKKATSNWTTTSDCVVWKTTVLLFFLPTGSLHFFALLYKRADEKSGTHTLVFSDSLYFIICNFSVFNTHVISHSMEPVLELQWRDVGFCHT